MMCPHIRELLDARRRIEQALHAVDDGGLGQRVSTRAADDLLAEMGADSGTAKSGVSWICERLDERVETTGVAPSATSPSRRRFPRVPAEVPPRPGPRSARRRS